MPLFGLAPEANAANARELQMRTEPADLGVVRGLVPSTMKGRMDKGHVPHHSKLGSARERFLASVLEYAFDDGWRTAQDFLRHFEPSVLVRCVSQDDELRTRLLTQTTRVHERLAPRKTVASAAEDLQLALETGLTDAAKILELIPADDRVRCFDARLLWAFLTEDEFWKADKRDRDTRERLVQRVTFVLERALAEGLLRLQDIAEGIGFKMIATCLPHAELQRLVEHALSRAREGQRLTEEQLLEAVPLRSLMLHVPLEHTWDGVVVAKLAEPLGFTESDDDDEEDKTQARLSIGTGTAVGSAAMGNGSLGGASIGNGAQATSDGRFDPGLLPQPLRELQRRLEAVTSSADEDEDEPVTRVAQDPRSGPNALSEAELERVTAALGRLGRLPPDHADLTLPILLSIESMYTELADASDEAARALIVREAFPNEGHLRAGLGALIRLLDPSRGADDPVLRHGDATALINAFLLEERRLRGNASSSPRAHAVE